jgi:hypothetical protein
MSEVLLAGLKIGESARWHEDRLWLSNWGRSRCWPSTSTAPPR